MLIGLADQLTDRLLTMTPQDLHQSFTQLCTNGQVETWFRWAKTSNESEARWLGRQAVKQDLSTAGTLLCLVCIWARQGDSLVRIQTRILIILEERGVRLVPFLMSPESDDADPMDTIRVRAAAPQNGQLKRC
jgi:hypothetical protein